MQTKNEISLYLENIGIIFLGILFLLFPLVITTATTDAYLLPKQIILVGIVLLTSIIFGAKMLTSDACRVRVTPFTIPLIVFLLVMLISSVLAVNRADAIIVYVPLFISVIAYFLVVNFVKSKQALNFILISFVLGATIAAILTLLSFFQIYVLPFPFTRVQTFSTLGSLLDQIIYFVIASVIAGNAVVKFIKELSSFENVRKSSSQQDSIKGGLFSIAIILMVIGIAVSIYQLFVIKPGGGLLLLPFNVGLQTAIGEITQDKIVMIVNGVPQETNRVIQGFLFGSGLGTFVTDFTRFKEALPFNLNQTLWSLTFIRSSSFVLEVLTTTGVLGLLSYLFIIFKVVKNVTDRQTKENSVFFSLLAMIIISFLLPFSALIQTVLFLVLALFAAEQGIRNHHEYFDIDLNFITFQKYVTNSISSPIAEQEQSAYRSVKTEKNYVVPMVFFVLLLIISSVIGYFSFRYVASDILFQQALVAWTANNRELTYNNETNAIDLFPYRDAYHRIYAQTTLILAADIASRQKQDATPSAEIQSSILTLIQKSIDAGNKTTDISPQTSFNWQTLSSIYRALIGFGQNAHEYAIKTQEQAIILNPNNPQGYIALGGIYYQLGQWDKAQQQFQIAINLKPNLANAYYNYGHTLEAKGDLQNAHAYYQTVKTLVAKDPQNLAIINADITNIQEKIGAAQNQAKNTQVTPEANQPPLTTNNPPANQLPEKKPPVVIPAPATASESAQ